MDPEFRIVIPARYESVRLPGKALRLIAGKPMIEWVYQAAQAARPREVIVATDDQRIADTVSEFGGRACMTASNHHSGTDRIVEVAQSLQWAADTIVVNLQGDEPLMPAANIRQVARNLSLQECAMATLHKPIDLLQARDDNLVKLVLDHRNRVLYFSRALIPYAGADSSTNYLGHIGLYAYRVEFIETFTALEPSRLELSESLEQLRALYHGYDIHSEVAPELPGPGVDTETDLAQVERLMAAGGR